MATLSEAEIFDRLRTSLRSAADLCEKLASEPSQGPNYLAIRDELDLIEGASRQAAYWRGDARWLRFGYEMARFQARIGDAIRSHMARDIFKAMAVKIRDALAEADQLRTARTGRRGLILPKPQPGPLRHRPVQVKTPGGIILAA